MSTSNETKPAAFFDLDRTLIGVNSGFLYALHERRSGRISAFQFARASFWLALYHLSLIDMQRAFAHAVRHYRGAHVDDLEELTTAFFHDQVVPTFQPGAQNALDHHRDQGHPLVLLTASSPYMSKLAAEQWQLDDWLCNRFPTDDEGYLHGTFERPMCYGQGKVHRATLWAEGKDVDLDESYFYTDSYSDLPMLERVGHPRVINPDPRLRRAAEKRGWIVEDWG